MSLYLFLEEEHLNKASTKLKLLQLADAKVIPGKPGSGASYIGLVPFRSLNHKNKSFDIRKKKPYYIKSRW